MKYGVFLCTRLVSKKSWKQHPGWSGRTNVREVPDVPPNSPNLATTVRLCDQMICTLWWVGIKAAFKTAGGLLFSRTKVEDAVKTCQMNKITTTLQKSSERTHIFMLKPTFHLPKTWIPKRRTVFSLEARYVLRGVHGRRTANNFAF